MSSDPRVHTIESDVLDDKVTGIAVEMSVQIAEKAIAYEVLVSSTVKDLVAGSGIQFDERGDGLLRGVEGKWRLFAVVSGDEAVTVREAAHKTPIKAAHR